MPGPGGTVDGEHAAVKLPALSRVGYISRDYMHLHAVCLGKLLLEFLETVAAARRDYYVYSVLGKGACDIPSYSGACACY